VGAILGSCSAEVTLVITRGACDSSIDAEMGCRRAEPLAPLVGAGERVSAREKADRAAESTGVSAVSDPEARGEDAAERGSGAGAGAEANRAGAPGPGWGTGV
jgi:hypothetical protein